MRKDNDQSQDAESSIEDRENKGAKTTAKLLTDACGYDRGGSAWRAILERNRAEISLQNDSTYSALPTRWDH